MAVSVLIIDDDKSFSGGLARILRRAGHAVQTCESAAQARSQIQQGFDVVIVDYQLPDADGVKLLAELKDVTDDSCTFLMATAFPDISVEIEAAKYGAFDYVVKGSDMRECLLRIERGVQVAMLKRRVSGFHKKGALAFIGSSKAARSIRDSVDTLSVSDQPLLLIGESGTGKTTLARQFHQHSQRATQTYAVVDCTNEPEQVRTEIFGRQKQSHYIGTDSLLVAAKGGTLVLEGVGILQPEIRSRILEILSRGVFRLSKESDEVSLDLRVILTTNRCSKSEVGLQLIEQVRTALDCHSLVLPPLREREEDIEATALEILTEHSRIMGLSDLSIEKRVFDIMQRYPFPGNIRELKYMIEQAALTCQDTELRLRDFPALRTFLEAHKQRMDQTPLQLSHIRQLHASKEKQILVDHLQNTGGNITAAARNIGISRYQLLRRLKKYNLR